MSRGTISCPDIVMTGPAICLGGVITDCQTMPVRLTCPPPSPLPTRQDNFVSHAMRAKEEAKIERINEKKSLSDARDPLVNCQ